MVSQELMSADAWEYCKRNMSAAVGLGYAACDFAAARNRTEALALIEVVSGDAVGRS